MPTSTLPSAPPVWECQGLRFIAFTETPFLGEQKWWSAYVGTDSEITLKRNHREERGPFGDGERLFLTIDPIQIHWALVPDISTIADNQARPLLLQGGFTDSRDRFAALINKWLPECPSVKRVAFHAKLYRMVENLSNLQDILNHYLARSCKLDRGSFDFLYRINRPRTEPTLNIVINRISTWCGVKFALAEQLLSVGPGLQVENAGLSQKELGDACQLELDINTHQEMRPAELKRLTQLFEVLMRYATEISEKGDVP